MWVGNDVPELQVKHLKGIVVTKDVGGSPNSHVKMTWNIASDKEQQDTVQQQNLSDVLTCTF